MAPSRALSQLTRAVGLSQFPVPLRIPATIHANASQPGSRQAFKPATRYAFFSTSISVKDVDPPDHLDESELKIFKKLKSELDPTSLEVQDISGGCGSMYGLDIVSPKFDGLSVIKQHKLVNQILAEDIKGWHGVQLKTRAP